jgi:hypothetical protein
MHRGLFKNFLQKISYKSCLRKGAFRKASAKAVVTTSLQSPFKNPLPKASANKASTKRPLQKAASKPLFKGLFKEPCHSPSKPYTVSSKKPLDVDPFKQLL